MAQDGENAKRWQFSILSLFVLTTIAGIALVNETAQACVICVIGLSAVSGFIFLAALVTSRWPRITVRTMAIIAVIAWGYFAAWRTTNNFAAGIGIPGWNGVSTTRPANSGPQYSVAIRAKAPLPLILAQDDIDYDETTRRFKTTRRHYVWLFGPKIKLPIDSTWEHPGSSRKKSKP